MTHYQGVKFQLSARTHPDGHFEWLHESVTDLKLDLLMFKDFASNMRYSALKHFSTKISKCILDLCSENMIKLFVCVYGAPCAL